VSPPSPLWYTTRGLGLVLFITLSAVVVLGVVTTRRWETESWPRFVTSELHRNLSLLALALLPLHGLTVVLDSYARLGLVDITVPFASAYRPLWLGLGVLAGELLIALVAISLVRQRLGHRFWRLTHWAAYVAWPLALLHGLGTGSDTRSGWVLLLYASCVAAVLLAVLVRLSLSRPGPSGWRVAAGFAISAGVLAVVIFTMLGPLQPGWAAAAGTPPDLLGGGPAASPSPSPAAP
jgi:sulfoxide reductase heme-binding subunit YedZ